MPFSYFAAAIISYLGLLGGIILTKLAPEEQIPGKPYFSLFKKIIFSISIAVFLFFYANIYITVIVLSFLFLLFATKKLHLEKNQLVYLLLGIIFVLSTTYQNLLILQSILIFIYGLPVASLLLKKNNYKEIVAKTIYFFIPVLLLPFLL